MSFGPLVVWRRSDRAPRIDGEPVPAAGSPGPVRCLWVAGHLGGERADPGRIEELYARFGTEAPDRVAGAVTWVLWDPPNGRLVAATDRIGSHRLFWLDRGEGLCLAAAVEPLLDELGSDRELDAETVVAHLHGVAPELDRTYFRRVRAVPPGGLLTATEGSVRVRRYWRPRLGPVVASDDAEAARLYRRRLQEAVEDHLPAGRFGVTVSGGLDSTSVAAAAVAAGATARATAYRWRAPDLPEADESELSAAVVARLGMSERTLDAGRHWTLSSPEGLVTWRASPFRGFFDELWRAALEQVAGDGVGVLLTGAGGDHLVGGNIFGYPDLLLTGRWLELGRQLREHLPRSEVGWRQVVKQMIVAPILVAWAPRLLPTRRPAPWLAADLRPPGRGLEPHAALPGRVQRLNVMRGRRIAQVMEATTREALAHGVDVRHPLFDHRLVELALSLPTHQTFRAGSRKIVVRNALRSELPRAVLERPLKLYPTAIMTRGLRHRETARVEELTRDMRAEALGFVDSARLRAVVRDYVDGRHDAAHFWYALTLEDWLRRHF